MYISKKFDAFRIMFPWLTVRKDAAWQTKAQTDFLSVSSLCTLYFVVVADNEAIL